MSEAQDLSRQLTLSVSGPRKAGRTELYRRLEEELPRLYPEHAFAFLGSPFGSLEHPHYWDARKRDLPASTRLLACWTQLDEFVQKHLRPALRKGLIAVTDGFGLDAVLHATASCDESECHEASQFHHLLVNARLQAHSVAPPVYLLAFDDAEAIAARIRRSLDDTKVLLAHETDGIYRYFDGTGQKPPHFLEGRSTDARFNETLNILQTYLD